MVSFIEPSVTFTQFLERPRFTVWGFDERAADVIATHHRNGPDIAAGPMSEVVYLAERLDIAATRSEKHDPSEVWEQAELNMPLDVLTDLFEVGHQREAPQGSRTPTRLPCLQETLSEI